MARVGRALGVALALFVAAMSRPSRADDESDRAEQSFRDGNRAFASGDYHAAFEAYRAAWSLRQSFDVACNLGRTEIELGLSRDAAEHLDYCLRTYSVSSRDDVRAAKERFSTLLQQVRREVGALTLEVRPAGTEITVDGASYGTAPLGHELFVTPGSHLVRAHLTGFRDEERSITAEPGAALGLSISLEANARPLAAAPVAGAPSRPQPARKGIEPRTIVVISGAAASLIALGVGVGFALDAGAAHADASRHGEAASETGTGCPPRSTSPDCVALTDAVSREKRSRHRADAALLTGVILGAATVGAWLVMPDLARSKTTSLRALPWIGRETTGVSLAGTY
ncbi:MAG TPA: PEGA domain-containing protein [Polyangiaceae bacterium]|nr:PEGA domain-containing protein [Polyangiaceae bacterium]